MEDVSCGGHFLYEPELKAECDCKCFSWTVTEGSSGLLLAKDTGKQSNP